jgi:hypothetical protein
VGQCLERQCKKIRLWDDYMALRQSAAISLASKRATSVLDFIGNDGVRYDNDVSS